MPLSVREKIRTPDTLVRSQVLYPAELRTHIQFIVSETRYNAGDRNRTGTVSLQQDFKSCASASSATPAYMIMGRGGFEPPKQVAADLQSVPFGHSGICPFITKQYKIDLLHSSIT